MRGPRPARSWFYVFLRASRSLGSVPGVWDGKARDVPLSHPRASSLCGLQLLEACAQREINTHLSGLTASGSSLAGCVHWPLICFLGSDVSIRQPASTLNKALARPPLGPDHALTAR